MMLGKWENFNLKHAGMLLSTTVSFFVTAMLLIHPYAIECTSSDMMCENWWLYGIASNVRIILFHIAIGRDAIRFKKQDRRGAEPNVRRKRAY